MEGVESVEISSGGKTIASFDAENPGPFEKTLGQNGRKREAPRTTVTKLLDDIREILDETLPPFEASIACTAAELPASITIKVAFKPEKEGTDTKEGESAQIVVSGKMALPSGVHEHDCSMSGGQMALFG